MSRAAMAAVAEATLRPSGKKFVAFTLAWFADDEGGSIRPSLSTVARRVSLSVDQVRRMVHELCRDGVLEVVVERPGRATEYRLLLHRLQPDTPCTDARGDRSAPLAPVQGVHLAPTQGVPLASTPATPGMGARQVDEQDVEQNDEQQPVVVEAAATDALPTAIPPEWHQEARRRRPDIDANTLWAKFTDSTLNSKVGMRSFSRWCEWLDRERTRAPGLGEGSRTPAAAPVTVNDIAALKPRSPAELAAASEAAAQQIPRLLALRDQFAGRAGR